MLGATPGGGSDKVEIEEPEEEEDEEEDEEEEEGTKKKALNEKRHKHMLTSR